MCYSLDELGEGQDGVLLTDVDGNGQLAQKLATQFGYALAGERSATLGSEKVDHVEDQADHQDVIADCLEIVARPARQGQVAAQPLDDTIVYVDAAVVGDDDLDRFVHRQAGQVGMDLFLGRFDLGSLLAGWLAHLESGLQSTAVGQVGQNHGHQISLADASGVEFLEPVRPLSFDLFNLAWAFESG